MCIQSVYTIYYIGDICIMHLPGCIDARARKTIARVRRTCNIYILIASSRSTRENKNSMMLFYFLASVRSLLSLERLQTSHLVTNDVTNHSEINLESMSCLYFNASSQPAKEAILKNSLPKETFLSDINYSMVILRVALELHTTRVHLTNDEFVDFRLEDSCAGKRSLTVDDLSCGKIFYARKGRTKRRCPYLQNSRKNSRVNFLLLLEVKLF